MGNFGTLRFVATLNRIVAWVALVLVSRREVATPRFEQAPHFEPTLYRPLLWKGMLASGLMLLAFILGLPIPLAALSAAALLLITRRLKPQRVFREMDWGLLVFFSGLFIVTGAIETAGLSQGLFAILLPVAEQGVAAFPHSVAHTYPAAGEYGWILTVSPPGETQEVASASGTLHVGPTVDLTSDPFPPLLTLDEGSARIVLTASSESPSSPISRARESSLNAPTLPLGLANAFPWRSPASANVLSRA